MARSVTVRTIRRLTRAELYSYLENAADILRGNVDHSEFGGYVVALLFLKRISNVYAHDDSVTFSRSIVRDQAELVTREGPAGRPQGGPRRPGKRARGTEPPTGPTRAATPARARAWCFCKWPPGVVARDTPSSCWNR